MTIQELKSTGALYIDNVVHGMQQYEHEILVMDSGKAEELFLSMWKTAGRKEAFVDFYYFVLKEEEKKAVEQELTPEEFLYLNKVEKALSKKKQQNILSDSNEQLQENQELVFPLDEILLKIAVKLNEKAVLFSTIYFTGEKKSTWWGNYDREYIRFK